MTLSFLTLAGGGFVPDAAVCGYPCTHSRGILQGVLPTGWRCIIPVPRLYSTCTAPVLYAAVQTAVHMPLSRSAASHSEMHGSWSHLRGLGDAGTSSAVLATLLLSPALDFLRWY